MTTETTTELKCASCASPAAPGRVRCATCQAENNVRCRAHRAAQRGAEPVPRPTPTTIEVTVQKRLTTGQVSKLCGVAPRTVSKWCDSGMLRACRIPGSLDRRIEVDDLVAFMLKHGFRVPYQFRPTRAVAYGLGTVVAPFEPLDAFQIGGLCATTPIRAVLVGDGDGLDAAVAVARAVRASNPWARIGLVLHEGNGSFEPPEGVFDLVARRPCDLAAVANQLTEGK